MFHLYVTHILAAAGTSSGGAAINDFFQNQTLGKIVSALMSVAGVILVIYAIVKAVSSVAAGKIPAALRTIALAVIFAAFLFDTSLIASVVDGLTSITQGIVNLFSSKTSAGN